MSVDTIGRYGDRHSADISTDTRPICRPSVGRVSVDMLLDIVSVNRPSVDTIGRSVDRHSADTSADMLRSTVGEVSVDCRWGIGRLSVRYRSTVNRCFAEIAAISLPTGDFQSIAYARRGGSRGRVQGVRSSPWDDSSSYWLLKFVYPTGQRRHSLEVHPLLR